MHKTTKPNIKLSQSIVDKHKEVMYNEKTMKKQVRGEPIKVRLQGKINCKILNCKISSLVCSKLMDQSGWPRHIDENVCDYQGNCHIHKAIIKNSMKGKTYDKRKKYPKKK